MNSQVRNLKETVKDLVELINILPEGNLMHQKWGPKEIVAHIVFWHEMFVEIASKSLNQERVDLINKSYRQINLEISESSQDSTVEELLERLILNQKKIEKLSFNPNTNNLQISLKKNTKSRSFQDSLKRMEQHIRNHTNRIKLELGSYDIFT